MGGISASKATFVENLIELAGYKAGIILTEAELVEIYADYGDFGYLLGPDGPEGFRLHSSEFEDAVKYLLYKIGNIETYDNAPITIQMFHKYKNNEKELETFHDVQHSYNSFMRAEIEKGGGPRKIDPSPFMLLVHEKHGDLGLDMAMEIIVGINRDMHASPWGSIRNIDWKDEVELNSLFVDENLETMHGHFFDQRFIDYVDRNFGEIGNIHWRKFEGLAGEYFARLGFQVDMGPGRNDDGIDLRIYPSEPKADTPPLIIVQCKRQKEKIGKTLLKSVYADVVHEKASSGLIVTSSTLSPGTEAMRLARGYPVEAADREKLKEWLEKMRSK